MKQEELESIEFNEIGKGCYKLKKVEITSPLVNVLGLVRIGNDYYTKEYLPYNHPFIANLAKPFIK